MNLIEHRRFYLHISDPVLYEESAAIDERPNITRNNLCTVHVPQGKQFTYGTGKGNWADAKGAAADFVTDNDINKLNFHANSTKDFNRKTAYFRVVSRIATAEAGSFFMTSISGSTRARAMSEMIDSEFPD